MRSRDTLRTRRTATRAFGAVALVCAVLAGTVQLATAGSGSQGALSPPAATPRAAADPATGSTAIQNLGAATGWKVLTSATATQSGSQISTPGFSTSGWLSVANDGGGAPGTEINALLQNGACPNVYFSSNMKSCFGQMTKIGADTIAQFSVPWWYRTDFTAPPSGQGARLILNGVVGSADVWVNGSQVASSSTVTGDYVQNVFNIGSKLVSGTNSLAIEMHPNNPKSMLTLDDVDWTQIPPDNNTGIQFPVQLETGGPLIVDDAHVNQDTADNLSSSALTVKASVVNVTGSAQTGAVTVTLTPPGGGSPISVTQNVTVAADATSTVTFTPASYPALTLSSPQIWWPYQMGAQPLYTLATSVAQNATVLNSTSETFGIRTVSSDLVGSGSAASSGVRQFGINGQPLVIRGGGWDPDLFLRYDPADTAQQIALMKSMGLNAIRLEGHFLPPDFYQQMDAAGILVNVGYQCCDEWENSGSAGTVYQNTATTQGAVWRNHPSIFSFQWSDNAPSSTQESEALNGFAAADYPGPFVSSAEYNSSDQLGVSGEKEGPYDWVPANYWYDTSHYPSGDSTLTNAGGAWGFDSEQSAGDTVPTMDSINRFLSASDQSALWQSTGANQYHTNYEGTGHSGYDFGTLYNLDQAISKRYGSWSSLAQYVQEAQAQNYEDTRAQFEAFIAHSTNATQPSTGTIYWQMNKGWPTLLWSLYNNDYDQAGAYFGAQEANRSLHAIYTLDNHTVTVDNLSGQTQSGVTVESKVYNTAGTLLDDQTSGSLSLASQKVQNKVLTPKLPSASNTVYFVELLVKQNGNVVDRNVYWDSTTPDAVNWGSTIPSGGGNPQATMSSYANLSALQKLPAATVSATASTKSQPGPNGADSLVTVTVTNKSTTPTVGFLLRADLRRGTASGAELSGDNEVTSAVWGDNDVTLWPGESETLTATYKSADLQGATPVVSLYGWNAAKTDVAAGTGTGVTNDFSLTDSPAAGTVTQGSSTTATVSTSVVGGSAESVALTASGLPTGATATFSPASVTAGGSSTLTVATAATTPAGTYPITITGTALSATHTASYSLTVNSSGGTSCTPAQLLTNPGFESGAVDWTQTSTLGFTPITKATSAEPAHSGSWVAWFNGNGSKDTDTAAQAVTIPAGCTAALSYWLHIDSTESTTTAKPDTFKVQVLNSSGTVLATVGSFSNLDAADGYTQRTADLSAYAGQTVTLKFTGSETDTSGGTTTFVADDTALQIS
ncbi:glycosyl hydrolase 2 galactose-binding domain-containing protein [Catenulispora pinisilvae]|uniref:glycosyl hydrolase 2 galactose-binding domain-containing protein n=1 Tax=Catenulispora pinisilvae TaxID=2705253 RepID=UPI0018924F53|nr:beta-mannosidase [Catenulispora pinisilvae]